MHNLKTANNYSLANLLFLVAKLPIFELPNHGYELLHIKLMKPTETIPVGFKLSKQTSPLKYIMTLIVEGSKADQAGLQVDDWLIRIEDRDIRLVALHDVLHDIYRLFNTIGFLNMLIARKKPSSTENSTLQTVTLRNTMNDATASPFTPEQSSADPNLDKIRRVILKDASKLHFKSFATSHNDQIYVHLINNIHATSIAYHAGLRNADRILAVNGTDVTQSLPENLRIILLTSKPVELNVINDSRYLQSLEIFETNSREITTRPQSGNVLFTDEQGPVYVKHSVIQQVVPYRNLGFSLLPENGVHVIANVEANYPGYRSGLSNNDIILFVNKKNVQHMTHENLTTLLRSCVLSNERIDLLTIHQTDLERYQNYRRKRFIDWYSILSKIDDSLINRTQGEIFFFE